MLHYINIYIYTYTLTYTFINCSINIPNIESSLLPLEPPQVSLRQC